MLCILALVAIGHQQTDTNGVFLLVCIAPVTTADGFFVPVAGGGTGGPYMQISVWDLHRNDRGVLDVALDASDPARLTIQLPVSTATPFLASFVSPLQEIWRMPSNSTVFADPDFDNPLCPRGAAVVILTPDRESDVVDTLGGEPLTRTAATVAQTVTVVQ